MAMTKTKKRLIAGVLVIALSLAGLFGLLPGNPHQARWDDYLSRLARLTRQPVPDTPALTLKPFPSPRALRQPFPEHRVDLLDYLQLRRCGLMQLISERNSASRPRSDTCQRWRGSIRQLRTDSAIILSTMATMK